MAKNRVVLLVLELLTFYCLLNCRQLTKKVDFSNDATITQINATQKYIAIKVKQKAESGFACLFDRLGNKLIEKKEENGIPFIQVEPSDTLNYFITVEATFNDAVGYPGPIGGVIHAFDVNTGNEVWKVQTNTSGYRISPDGMHLLNYDEGGPNPIINLRDGSKILLDKKYFGLGADWLDNERIVIAFQHRIANPDTKEYFEELHKRNRANEILKDSLINQRLLYSIDLDNGKITKEYYETKKVALTKEIDEIESQQVEENKKTNSEHKKATILAASKLRIYNIKTKQFEIEKDIYAPDGEPIVLNAGSPNIGCINVDRKTHSIYFYANKSTLSNINRNTACLVKIDKSLNVISILNVCQLNKINVEDETFLFQMKKDIRSTS